MASTEPVQGIVSRGYFRHVASMRLQDRLGLCSCNSVGHGSSSAVQPRMMTRRETVCVGFLQMN
jgi:hypothetical protein